MGTIWFPNTNNTKKPLLRMKVNSMKRKKKKWPKRNFGTLFTFLQLFVYKKSCLQFPILQSKAYYTKATFFFFYLLKLFSLFDITKEIYSASNSIIIPPPNYYNNYYKFLDMKNLRFTKI